jgi:hypothetical protein
MELDEAKEAAGVTQNRVSRKASNRPHGSPGLRNILVCCTESTYRLLNRSIGNRKSGPLANQALVQI